MPTGTATASASATARQVNASVVGRRSVTRPNAGTRWKNDWPKSPRAALATKRTSCRASESVSPSASRSLTRSASGASGMIRATGSPLAWRIENVTMETPIQTTTKRRRRRIRNADTAPPPDLASVLRLGREEPEPLVGPCLVRDLLRDAERVVLRIQEDRRRLFPDHPLDLRVDPLALRLIEARAGLVDELVEPLDARVLLAEPRHHLLEHRLLVDGVVRGLARGLLVERRAPHVE